MHEGIRSGMSRVRRQHVRFAAGVFAAVGMLFGFGEARAQETEAGAAESEVIANLRQTIEILRERLRLAAEERELLLARIGQLEDRLGMKEEETPPAEDRAPVPEDPFASPASLMEGLKAKYEAEIEPPESDDPEAIEEYHAAIAKWCRETSRTMRERREWVVSVEEVVRSGRKPATAWMRVIDPATKLPIGSGFSIVLSDRFASRVERGKAGSLWTLRLLVVGQPRYSAGRATPGIFDAPPLVGPYVEFGWSGHPYAIFPYVEKETEPVNAGKTDEQAKPSVSESGGS